MKRNKNNRFYSTLILLTVSINGYLAKYYVNSDFDTNPFMDPVDLASGFDNNKILVMPPGGAAASMLEMTTKQRSDVEISYDVQANQLLQYLNSAKLFAANNNKPLLGPLEPVRMSNLQAAVQNGSVDDSQTMTNSSIDSAMRRKKFNSILSQINETYKINFDGNTKGFRFDKSKHGKIKECLNCSDIKNSSECKEINDFEYYELINLFCCQCNANV